MKQNYLQVVICPFTTTGRVLKIIWLFFLVGLLTGYVRTPSAQAQTLKWAKSMGGASIDFGNSIAVDRLGNVYTTGYFSGTSDFDPGPGVFNLTAAGGSAGGSDIFVSKLDASGNFIWAKQLGGANYSIGGGEGNSIAVDGDGNVYTTGHFSGIVDFDPGIGVFNLSTNGSAIFVSKLDTDGNFVWAKEFDGTGSSNHGDGVSIAVDNSGNVYTTGTLWGTLDFDPGPGVTNLTSAGLNDIFVSKLNTEGNFVWASAMGGTNNDIVYSIAVDGTGNVYTTGFFKGTADFDPGSGVFNLSTSIPDDNNIFDIFISKLDVGGKFLWAKRIGNTNYNRGRSVAVDGSGNAYITGSFTGTADFDPGPGIFNLTSVGADIFVSKLDANGNFVWAKQIGSARDEESHSIVLDGAGNIYTTGDFRGTVDFDPGPGVFNLTSTGFNNIFVSKLDANGNFVWAANFGSTSANSAILYALSSLIALDGVGNVYIVGYFSGSVDFDPGPGVTNLTSVGPSGSSDVFVVKISQQSGLLLLAPTYNCTTGAFTFNTSGGDGSPITFSAVGITSPTTNPNQFVDTELRTVADAQPITLKATQNGVTVSYIWDIRAVCPVVPDGSLRLLVPTYDCTTGAFKFNTSGGNGATIEYRAVPGITDWSTNPNQFVDKESRTASDVQPFQLQARQNGVVTRLVWDLKAACGRARLTTTEPPVGMQVLVLGNPMAGETINVEVSGVERQPLQFQLSNFQGQLVSEQHINQAAAMERVKLPLSQSAGVYLLQVSSPNQLKVVRVLKAN